ncbi:hypothetical protein FB45DRAFT_940081 [Roridomyces roridus]|uniref:Uncharacterized protein n=1 Tax=Roridomyces roridus TaxID=1738132 RepID=A0AAD7B6Q9_9AGAR|nr:hypothetical protein FB45DRAFT_940081 [Roridomyces roridus]
MFSRSLLRPTSLVSRRLGATSYSATAAQRSSHTSDSYSKEVDSSPASDSTIHRVDPSSENVQKPHEPPSGRWSATGVDAGVKHAQGKGETGMDEYRTMDAAERPYAAPGEKDRYGATHGDPQQETSTRNSQQGPQGSDSGGRKPEGR